jgi:hypothetical protein
VQRRGLRASGPRRRAPFAKASMSSVTPQWFRVQQRRRERPVDGFPHRPDNGLEHDFHGGMSGRLLTRPSMPIPSRFGCSK